MIILGISSKRIKNYVNSLHDFSTNFIMGIYILLCISNCYCACADIQIIKYSNRKRKRMIPINPINIRKLLNHAAYYRKLATDVYSDHYCDIEQNTWDLDLELAYFINTDGLFDEINEWFMDADRLYNDTLIKFNKNKIYRCQIEKMELVCMALSLLNNIQWRN